MNRFIHVSLTPAQSEMIINQIMKRNKSNLITQKFRRFLFTSRFDGKFESTGAYIVLTFFYSKINQLSYSTILSFITYFRLKIYLIRNITQFIVLINNKPDLSQDEKASLWMTILQRLIPKTCLIDFICDLIVILGTNSSAFTDFILSNITDILKLINLGNLKGRSITFIANLQYKVMEYYSNKNIFYLYLIIIQSFSKDCQLQLMFVIFKCCSKFALFNKVVPNCSFQIPVVERISYLLFLLPENKRKQLYEDYLIKINPEYKDYYDLICKSYLYTPKEILLCYPNNEIDKAK